MSAAFTAAQLRAMGRQVVNGQAVAITDDAPDEDLTWQRVEAAVRRVFEKAGCTVYSTSQRRRSKVSAGLPDCLIFGPPGHPFHAYFECKAGRGALTEAQRQFALHCQRTHTPHASGGVRHARQFLKLLLQSPEAA